MQRDLRSTIFNQLLELYHETIIQSLTDILACDKNDPRLSPYSSSHFEAHWIKFGFYGAFVAFTSTSWMACPEDECQRMADYFANDMHNPGFAELAMICGGNDVSERVASVAQHASRMGYMEMLDDL